MIHRSRWFRPSVRCGERLHRSENRYSKPAPWPNIPAYHATGRFSAVGFFKQKDRPC